MTNPVGRKRGRYQTRPGGPCTAPSVTMVLGILNKPGLSWGSAKETAIFAVLHRDQWEHLDEGAAIDRLYRHHRGIWDGKAALGTTVHALATDWAAGREVDCPPDCTSYLDALERFYVDWRPRWVETERTVVYDHDEFGYGGTFDAIADLRDGHRWLLDLKTGKDVWPEAAMQLSAYRYAQSIGTYDETGDLVSVDPMIPVDRAGVVHLNADGSYGLVPVKADEDIWQGFLSCRRMWGFWTARSEHLVGEPIAMEETTV